MLSFLFGAGKEVRTLDLYLGKVSLYQLSYSRDKTLNPGGATQSRTGLTGFAIRGITDLLSHHNYTLKLKGKAKSFPSDLEREKRFELSTYTLARYRSTS